MSREEGELDLAFLGCGEVTATHSRTLSRLGAGVRFHYASRDREKAEAYARRHDGAAAYGSYEEALEAPEVDAVLVATPPSSHLELTLGALEAGKDVIVEKPPFPRSEDFDRVERARKQSGRRVLVAENYHYKPLRVALARILARGWIGEPLVLQVNAVKRQETEGWRTDPALAGGGALFEGGIHWVNFMAGLGLTVERVRGLRPGDDGEGPERTMVVGFEYAEGPVGTLTYSWEVPSTLKGLRLSKLYGRSGSVTFETNGVFLLLNGTRRRLKLLPGLPDLSGYRAMFRDFLDALRTGREAGMTLEMARRDVRLVEEAYRTAER